MKNPPVFFIQLLILEGRKSVFQTAPRGFGERGAGILTTWRPADLPPSAIRRVCVCVTRPQRWGPECPPVEVLETKVSRWLRMCGPSVSKRQPCVRFFPKNEGFSVYCLGVRVPCCPGSPPWPECPLSHGGGFLEEKFQVREGFCTGSPGGVAPRGVSGSWGLGPLPWSVMSPRSGAWSFRADGWSEAPGALCPDQE